MCALACAYWVQTQQYKAEIERLQSETAVLKEENMKHKSMIELCGEEMSELEQFLLKTLNEKRDLQKQLD